MSAVATPLTIATAWVVWSHKHHAWWAPNRAGYVRSLAYAGVYSEEEAREIEAASAANPPALRSEARRLTHADGEMGAMRPGSVTWLLTEEANA